MNNALRKIKRLIGAALLTVFIFSFLHSELGFINHDNDNHSSHDHCTIVNGSTTPASRTNALDLTNLKADFIFLIKTFDKKNQNALAFFSETDNPHYTEKTNKVYLDNNIFLI